MLSEKKEEDKKEGRFLERKKELLNGQEKM